MQLVRSSRFLCPRIMAAGSIALLCLAVAVPGTAQFAEQPSEATPSPTQQPPPPPEPKPIPASDIPSRAAAAADIAREAVTNAAPDARVQDIQQGFPAEQARINQLREATTKQLKAPGPASTIKETQNAVARSRDRLDRWLADLSTRSSALDTTLEDLQSRTSIWRLTRDNESAAALPEELIQQVADTIEALTDAENQVLSARDSILGLQASIAQEKSGVDALLADQQSEISKRTKGLFGIDSPPLWKAFGGEGDSGDALSQFAAIQQEHWRSLESYVTEQGWSLLIWILMWPALALLMVAMKRKATVWVQQDTSLQRAVEVLSRPVSAALAVTAILNESLQPKAPSVWVVVVSLALVVALLRLLPVLLPQSMSLASVLVALLYLMRRAVRLAPEGFVVHRLALLFLAAVGIVTCVWVIHVLKTDPGRLSKAWHRAVLLGARAALALFTVGALADVIGSVEFSALALTGTAYALLAAVLIWVVSVILRSMVRIVLLSDAARRSGIAPDHSETVRRTVFRFISVLAVVWWVVAVLKSFFLLDPLLLDVRHALDWKLAVGEFSIAPGDILIFGFTIWLSMKLATFVQFILNVDLLPRVDLPRGVPQTISRLARYAVITVGAVVASAAAGLDISKVTIIVGALGVGIGFGLQNIVNNFVSGLILLFERPIRVGDTLDLHNTGGVVETIGMRASIVNTWEGAEIIVPNANLISEDVVNWTLTHDRRRISLPVGVAYGTDPEKAAQLIVDVAHDHKAVDASPKPICLFVGFGDSSLDLELRAWAAGSDFLQVASDLRFTIVRKLTEAGIEIPFPQREIHLHNSTQVPAVSETAAELTTDSSSKPGPGAEQKTVESKERTDD